MPLFVGVALLATFTSGKKDDLKYKNPSYSISERVVDLVSRMTLEEKVAQLDMLRGQDVLIDAKTLNKENVAKYLENNTLGSIHDFYPVDAEIANELQRHVMENSRLGIPIIFIEEALHGYNGPGSTNFPIPLANAATWDTTMVRNTAAAIAAETRAHGVHFVLGPNLDLAREIRWGRVEETFGEDAYLSSRMAVNMVKGLQGDTLASDNSVAAEPKHFVIHGIPENGKNSAPPHIGEREARTDHMYTFEKAVTEGKAKGIMAAYHEIDGIPSASNKWTLTDVLRGEWGFDGFVVSDLGAVNQQISSHKTAANAKEAISASINAGLNMQFYDFSYDVFQSTIIECVGDGTISMETLDRAVSDVLRVKFELGIFDNPYTDPSLIARRHNCPEHQQLAKDMALNAITLLKNDNNTLPFSPEVKHITLVGNLADYSAVGGYSPTGSKAVTVYEALKKRFGNDVVIDLISSDVSKNFTTLTGKNLFQDKDATKVGLKVEYFNNTELTGTPVFTTIGSDLSPYWHNLSPAPGVNENNFSARWSGYLNVPFDGAYEFSLVADDRAKIYINDKLLIDVWDYNKKNKRGVATVDLKAGTTSIKVEFSELDEFAAIGTQWRIAEMGSSDALFGQIAESAAKADVVIAVVGENMAEVGEGKDKADLSLSEFDKSIVEAAVASGKPTATVLFNGRPIILTNIIDTAPAILEAWYPGESGGDAICDIIFGDFNPTGHLTMTFPKDQNMLPSYYSRRPSSGRDYVDGDGKDVNFSFGHGLSYTTFDYSNLKVVESASISDDVMVSVDVTNSGDRDGADVVQLYMRDVVSSTTTPVIALKGFSKVFVKAGETKTVTMKLTPEHFSLINREMKRVVEPGEFIIMIGRSSSDIVLKETITLK